MMDMKTIASLLRFFEILDTEGEEAAIKYAEEQTGEKIADKEKPHLRVVDEA